MPFYAGWGLTRDLAPPVRAARAALVARRAGRRRADPRAALPRSGDRAAVPARSAGRAPRRRPARQRRPRSPGSARRYGATRRTLAVGGAARMTLRAAAQLPVPARTARLRISRGSAARWRRAGTASTASTCAAAIGSTGPAPATNYRGTLRDWPVFFDDFIVDHGVTDVVLFGDCRPHHASAHGMAKLRGLRVHVLEEGYIRPDFVTLEEGGVNGHSPMPRDPAWFRAEAARLPPEPPMSADRLQLPPPRSRDDRAICWRRVIARAAVSLLPHASSATRPPSRRSAGRCGRRPAGRANASRRTLTRVAERGGQPLFPARRCSSIRITSSASIRRSATCARRCAS